MLWGKKMMKHQNDVKTLLRWFVGVAAIGLYVWASVVSYIIVMVEVLLHVDLLRYGYVVEWLTYGGLLCVIGVLVLPSEFKNEKAKIKQKDSTKVGDG